MVKCENNEERKIYNAPFLRVFDYLAEEKHMNQGEFSKFIGIESGYISLLRSGSKRVGPKYIALISVEFSKHFEALYLITIKTLDYEKVNDWPGSGLDAVVV